MKYYILLCCFALVLSSCDKEPKPGSRDTIATTTPAIFATPGDAMNAMTKAMKDKDSVALMNVLSVKTRDKIVQEMGKLGGFKTAFAAMDMVKMDITYLGADSSGSDFTKVFVTITASKDTSKVKIDSAFFPAVREDGGWKLLSLSGRPVSQVQMK